MYPRHKRLTPEPREAGVRTSARQTGRRRCRPSGPVKFLLVCGSACRFRPPDGAGLQYSLLKNTLCKWTYAVQTLVIQGSTAEITAV